MLSCAFSLDIEKTQEKARSAYLMDVNWVPNIQIDYGEHDESICKQK